MWKKLEWNNKSLIIEATLGFAKRLVYIVNVYRYSELRLSNQKATRQLGEKDEQLQEMRQKIDSVGVDLRKSEKAKREVISGLFIHYCDDFRNMFTVLFHC